MRAEGDRTAVLADEGCGEPEEHLLAAGVGDVGIAGEIDANGEPRKNRVAVEGRPMDVEEPVLVVVGVERQTDVSRIGSGGDVG